MSADLIVPHLVRACITLDEHIVELLARHQLVDEDPVGLVRAAVRVAATLVAVHAETVRLTEPGACEETSLGHARLARVFASRHYIDKFWGKRLEDPYVTVARALDQPADAYKFAVLHVAAGAFFSCGGPSLPATMETMEMLAPPIAALVEQLIGCAETVYGAIAEAIRAAVADDEAAAADDEAAAAGDDDGVDDKADADGDDEADAAGGGGGFAVALAQAKYTIAHFSMGMLPLDSGDVADEEWIWGAFVALKQRTLVKRHNLSAAKAAKKEAREAAAGRDDAAARQRADDVAAQLLAEEEEEGKKRDQQRQRQRQRRAPPAQKRK